ncbi:hypothetical protein OG552_10460 [Streptomyces sp. NBC_01476]|uniref:hypothetical protein n=1 Tax=Streptomyces sp. NBC_01476 TaxID=2903881 RepID=UPI002E3547C6|nr:hypothetical protein [Streptomyces sp. NBC_01476]
MADTPPLPEGELTYGTIPVGSVFAVADPAPPTITIQGGNNGRPLVTIHPDGTLEYGDGYDPDDAARRFWDALRTHMPTRCPNCGHIPHGEAL